MTPHEYRLIDSLRTEMNEGFREMRELIETRRTGDEKAHDELDGRLRWLERAVYGGALAATVIFGGPALLG